MIATIVIFSFFILLLSWVIFSPIRITVNTWGGFYRINWLWMLTFEVSPTEDFLVFRINYPFGSKTIDPLDKADRQKKSDKETETKKNVKPGRSLKRGKQVAKVIFRFINSFHIDQLKIVFPADDYILSAQLQPLFQLFRSYGLSVHTSYTGDEGFRFEGHNRVSSLLYHGFNVFALNK